VYAPVVDPYKPLNTLKPIDEILWSPTELGEGLRSEVDALGPVRRHLVSPNKLHYAHITAWKRAYPRARPRPSYAVLVSVSWR